MIRLAITGGIACGKSLCGEHLRQLGCPVCDTDVIAHALLARGSREYEVVLKLFGQRILDKQGAIDRRLLGRLVFSDSAALAQLNRLLHPEIRRRMTHWLAEQQTESRGAAVLIPLFYETAEPLRNWDLVICVAASRKVCRQRMRKRGWSPREIAARQGSQMPLDEKILRADIVLHNDGSPAWLRHQVEIFYRRAIQTENKENDRTEHT